MKPMAGPAGDRRQPQTRSGFADQLFQPAQVVSECVPRDVTEHSIRTRDVAARLVGGSDALDLPIDGRSVLPQHPLVYAAHRYE